MTKSPASSPTSGDSIIFPHYLRSGFNFPAPIEDRIRATSGNRLSDEQLHALVVLNHHLDAGRLNHTLRLVMDSNPILGCRYNPHKNTWERRSDLDHQNIWTVHVQTRRFSFDSRPGVHRFVDSPRFPNENGVVEARIFRNGTDLLVLKVHHAITDAGGLKALLYQITHTYNKLATDPEYRPKVSFLERDVYHALQKPAESMSQTNTKPGLSTWNFPSPKSNRPQSPAISLQKIPQAIWRRLDEYSRLNSVYFEELIVSAYYLALFDILTAGFSQKLPLILQKDLRSKLPAHYKNSVANLSAEFPLSLEIQPGETAPQVLPRIRNEYQKALQTGELAKSVLNGSLDFENLFRKFYREHSSDKSVIIPSIANYGELESARLRFDQQDPLDAYLVGPIQYTPRLHLTSSVFKENMTLSARYCTSIIDPDLVEKLIHSFIAHLSDF